MAKVQISQELKEWFNRYGVDKLPDFLELLGTLVLTKPMQGRKRTLTISATAGNVSTDLSPSVGKRWTILYGQMTCVCDANAADRSMSLALRTEAGQVLHVIGSNSTAWTAGQTKGLGFGPVIFQVGGYLGSFNVYFGLSEQCIIEGTEVFRVAIGNGQAGDSYSGVITVLEVDV